MLSEGPRYMVKVESGCADSLAVECAKKRGIKKEEDVEKQVFSAIAQAQFWTGSSVIYA